MFTPLSRAHAALTAMIATLLVAACGDGTVAAPHLDPAAARQMIGHTIFGHVSSPQRPSITGAIVSAAGFSAVTEIGGRYELTVVVPQNRRTVSVSVSNLPEGCEPPPVQVVTIPRSGFPYQELDFSVTCTPPTTTFLRGTVHSSLGPPLVGVQVIATPTGGSPSAAAVDSSGMYFVTVPLSPSTGLITLANLPAACTTPEPIPYFASGWPVVFIAPITVSCAPGPVTYPLSAVWGPITNTGPTGRQVTLDFSIDMGGAPGRLDVNGEAADDLAGIGFSLRYNGVGLTPPVRTLLHPTGAFNLGFVLETNGGTDSATANVFVGSSVEGTAAGSFPFIRLTFDIRTGFSGTIIGPRLTMTEATASIEYVDVRTSILVLPIPALIIP